MFTAVQFMPDGETNRSYEQIKDIVHSNLQLTTQISQEECQIKGKKHLCPIVQLDMSYSARKLMPNKLPVFFHIHYLAVFWPKTKSTPIPRSQYLCYILSFKGCISGLFHHFFAPPFHTSEAILVQS